MSAWGMGGTIRAAHNLAGHLARRGYDVRMLSVTGPNDIVDDHRNGILVTPEDTKAFAAALRELIDDESLRRRLGPAAARTAAGYGMDAIGPRWEALFAELVAAASRAGGTASRPGHG